MTHLWSLRLWPTLGTATLALVIASLAGCDLLGGESRRGEATALKDGQPWQAIAQAEWRHGKLHIDMSLFDGDCYRGGLGVALPRERFVGLGIYRFEPGSALGAGYHLVDCDASLGPGWVGMAGSWLEITHYDERRNHVEGRFEITLAPVEGGADTLRFTEGRFEAPLSVYQE